MTLDSSTRDRENTQNEPELTFESLNLSAGVIEAIEKMGFSTPTPVQYETYRDIMEGADLLVQSRTGTGKTAAYGIPLSELLDAGKNSVQALVMLPTRELAVQVSRELNAISGGMGIKALPVYGGVSFGRQKDEANKGVQIVVGTPGRILDHMRRSTMDFSSVRHLVLDEGDEMLSMGFEKDISAIIQQLPERSQTLLFSATIPDAIKRLADSYMTDSRTISLSDDSVGPEEITHLFYLASGACVPDNMLRILEIEKPESALIFCNTREQTLLLAKHLKNNGYDAEWISSDLGQGEREKVMQASRDGKLRFLVATDVAARGIDISHLTHVINYSFPESLEVYIHRTGRTGRIGNTGTAISIITPKDIGNLYYLRLTYNIRPVERHLPDEKEISSLKEQEQLIELGASIAEKPEDEWYMLLRRLRTTLDSDRILASLLKNHFSSKDTDTGKKKPDVKAAPAPKTGEAEKPVEKTAGKTEKKPEKKPEKKRPSSGKDEDSVSASSAESPEKRVGLDVGRNDGVRISLILKALEERCRLQRKFVGKVIVRANDTVIHVPSDRAEDVARALDGMETGNRKAGAEVIQDEE